MALNKPTNDQLFRFQYKTTRSTRLTALCQCNLPISWNIRNI